MRRLFAQNLLFSLAANALVKPAYILLIDRVVQGRAGTEAFGRYAALFNLATIFGVVLDFGIAQYATGRLSAMPSLIYPALGPLLRARLALCVVYAAAVAVAAVGMGFRGADLALLGVLLLIQALAQTLLFLRACTASLQRFKTDAALAALDRGLMVVGFGAVLLAVRERGAFWVEWFAAAQVAAYAIGVAVAAYALRAAMRGIPRQDPPLKERAWTGLRGSLPYAAMVLLMATYTRSDMLLLERLYSAAEAGRYAASFRLLDVGNMVSLVVAGILLPLFGRMLAQGAHTGPVVRVAMALLMPLAIAVSATCMFMGSPILEAVYPTLDLRAPGAGGRGSGQVLALLMLSFPAMGLVAVYSTLLTARGRIRAMIAIAGAAAVLNLSLNFFFLPGGGADAAAAIAAATQWGAAIAYAVVASRAARLQPDATWIAAHVATAAVTCVGTLCAAGLFNSWWMTGIAALALAGGAAVAFGLVRIGELRGLLRRGE